MPAKQALAFSPDFLMICTADETADEQIYVSIFVSGLMKKFPKL